VHKLILIFHRQEDPDHFESRWSHEFVPLAERMPGVRKVAVSRVLGGLSPQSDTVLIHELYFEDRGALETGMASSPGQKAGETLMDIAGDSVEILFSEHREDQPHPGPVGGGA
jgi:uncharacterized protein (TIGR02118 family)